MVKKGSDKDQVVYTFTRKFSKFYQKVLSVGEPSGKYEFFHGVKLSENARKKTR